MMSNWQAVGDGIMLWAPPSTIELDTTSQSLSQLSVGAENIEGKNSKITPASCLPTTI
jgi:hypothetical protein